MTGDFKSICNYLVSTDVLKRADDLAAQGSNASSDMAIVHTDLQKVAAVAPSVTQTELHNILNQLGTDSRLLAGECRARNLPTPSTG